MQGFLSMQYIFLHGKSYLFIVTFFCYFPVSRRFSIEQLRDTKAKVAVEEILTLLFLSRVNSGPGWGDQK